MRGADQSRNSSGMSIITIIGIAAVMMLWLLGTVGIILPSYSKVTRARQNAMLRMDLESSLNWAIAQLEKTPPPFDDPTMDGQPITMNVPASLINDGTQVILSINNIAPTTDSGQYVPNLDSSIPANNIPANGWRVLVANGKRGQLQKSMRTVLMPRYGNAAQGSVAPIFDFALFAQNDVTTVGPVTTRSYNSAIQSPMPTSPPSTKASIGANGSVTVSAQSSIGGDVQVSSLQQSPLVAVVTVEDEALVNGVVKANGGAQIQPLAKVANAGRDSAGPVQTRARMAQRVLPPVPALPSDVKNLGSLAVAEGQSYTLPSGAYVIHDLTVGANATLNVEAGGTADLYIQNSNAPYAVSIHNQAIINQSGKPANLRIWYTGRGGITFGQGANYTGVIHAPSALVQIGSNSTVNGALTGSRIKLGGGTVVNYDLALRTNASGLMYSSGQKPLAQLQPVIWQEN